MSIFSSASTDFQTPGFLKKPGVSRAGFSRAAKRRTALFASAAMLLSASACTTTGWNPQSETAAARSGAEGPVDVTSRERYTTRTQYDYDPELVNAYQLDEHADSIVQPLSYDVLTDASAASARISAPRPTIQQTALWDDQVAQTIAHSAEPRVHLPADCPPGVGACPPGYPALPAGPMEMPPYPEEILCDGGDRLYPFHYEGDRVGGLDPEDTVADYVDHTGKAHHRISSRTCVYAPKFAAVRTISQPVQDYSVDRLGGAHEGLAAAGINDGLPLAIQQQTDQLNAMQLRLRASGVAVTAGDMNVHLAVSPEQHIKINNTYEDRAYLTEGRLHQTSEAYQTYVLSIAGEAITDIGPIIVASDVFGQEVIAGDHVEEYSVVEDPRPVGDLRVVKQADQLAIQPGEVLTYKITFFNDGGRELTNVRIMDHLSPRLDYVPGSAVTEREGQLNIELAPDGSQILSFELAEPLLGGESGEITFQVRAK